MSLTRAIAGNTVVQVAGKFIGTLLGILTVAVMTRLLGLAGYGEFTTAISFLQFFGILVDFGLTLTMIRMISDAKAEETRVASNIFTLRLVSGIVFFGAAAGIAIVDMPGYGYARAPKRQVAEWTKLVFDFLRGRASLRRVYVLVDARHGLKENDREALKVLDKAAVSYQVVLTKADKVKAAELARVRDELHEMLRKHPAAHPEVLATSAGNGLGIAELRAEIARFATQTIT